MGTDFANSALWHSAFTYQFPTRFLTGHANTIVHALLLE
jgi:hypothetical protein